MSTPPQHPRLDASRQRLKYDWSSEFQWLNRLASANGIRDSPLDVTPWVMRILTLQVANCLAWLPGDPNSTDVELPILWYDALILFE